MEQPVLRDHDTHMATVARAQQRYIKRLRLGYRNHQGAGREWIMRQLDPQLIRVDEPHQGPTVELFIGQTDVPRGVDHTVRRCSARKLTGENVRPGNTSCASSEKIMSNLSSCALPCTEITSKACGANS